MSRGSTSTQPAQAGPRRAIPSTPSGRRSEVTGWCCPRSRCRAAPRACRVPPAAPRSSRRTPRRRPSARSGRRRRCPAGTRCPTGLGDGDDVTGQDPAEAGAADHRSHPERTHAPRAGPEAVHDREADRRLVLPGDVRGGVVGGRPLVEPGVVVAAVGTGVGADDRREVVPEGLPQPGDDRPVVVGDRADLGGHFLVLSVGADVETQRRTPPGGPRRGRPSSSASCPPFCFSSSLRLRVMSPP